MSGANNTKGNFKTYEGQARLLRAMVAAHPEVKWNCKGMCDFHSSLMVGRCSLVLSMLALLHLMSPAGACLT